MRTHRVPGGHDRYTAADWKQGLNSEMHCLAGDATGIIVAASVVPTLALADDLDLLIEYAAGFVLGLFVFQALMMVGMYGGNYLLAVRKTFFAETVSMNKWCACRTPVLIPSASERGEHSESIILRQQADDPCSRQRKRKTTTSCTAGPRDSRSSS